MIELPFEKHTMLGTTVHWKDLSKDAHEQYAILNYATDRKENIPAEAVCFMRIGPSMILFSYSGPLATDKVINSKLLAS